MAKKLRLISDSRMNYIRGRASVGAATTRELMEVFEHIDAMEMKLDECDKEDMLGTQGWRYYLGHPDAE